MEAANRPFSSVNDDSEVCNDWKHCIVAFSGTETSPSVFMALPRPCVSPAAFLMVLFRSSTETFALIRFGTPLTDRSRVTFTDFPIY